MKLRGYGIEVELPGGWEGRIYRRPEGFPILHAANFALPFDAGDFGSGAVESMSGRDAFTALLEYDPTLAGTGLFAPSGLPLPLRGQEASPKTLQRRLPGRAAIQRFFTQAGRAFCLYVVLPSGSRLRELAAETNSVLGTVTIDSRRKGP